MNTISRILALALALAPLSAMAYQKADNIEEAKSKAGKDGIVLITYAEGWDKHSKKTAERMMEAAAIKKALGDAVVIRHGVRNVTSKDEQEKITARFGKTDLSFPNSYPAFIFYNKDGYRLADYCIKYSDRKKPKKVAKQLKKILDASARQQDLLAKADAATGVEQARLLGEAAAVPGLRKPDQVAQRIKKADPQDQSGMHRIVTLNLYETAIQTAKTEDWQATLAEMKELMQNPLLTTDHKQQICCICIGLLHRHGGLAHKQELKETIDKLEELDPDSVLGKSAVDARRLWVKDLTLAEGWNPGVLPADTTPVEVVGDIPMTDAGTYTVTLTYTSGPHQANIKAVELYDGKKKVAEDRHDGSTGIRHNNNVYTLEVPAKVKKPRLYITFNMGNSRNSNGLIKIQKK